MCQSVPLTHVFYGIRIWLWYNLAMKLLILTQKVDKNDDLLGFFHAWLEEFGKLVSNLTVVCLQLGEQNLPQNIKIHSLGKEKKVSRIRYIASFYKYIFKAEYDIVFVHMNQVYVLLGAIFWKLMGKKVVLWYTHRQLTFSLRIAHFLVDEIMTADTTSFPIKSDKVKAMGHGIDVSEFYPRPEVAIKPNIVSVARISRIKNQLQMVKAIPPNGILDIVGDCMTESDLEYRKEIESYIAANNIQDRVIFHGKVPNRQLPELLSQMKVAVNLAPVGLFDKAVIESVCMGLPIVVSNRAFAKLVPGYEAECILNENFSTEDLKEKLNHWLTADTTKYRNEVSTKVREEYSHTSLVKRIVNEIDRIV